MNKLIVFIAAIFFALSYAQGEEALDILEPDMIPDDPSDEVQILFESSAKDNVDSDSNGVTSDELKDEEHMGEKQIIEYLITKLKGECLEQFMQVVKMEYGDENPLSADCDALITKYIQDLVMENLDLSPLKDSLHQQFKEFFQTMIALFGFVAIVLISICLCIRKKKLKDVNRVQKKQKAAKESMSEEVLERTEEKALKSSSESKSEGVRQRKK